MTEARTIERVRYWQGQKLRSRDFNDIGAVEAQRRWWHNRAVHEAYGVATGLEALLSSPETAPDIALATGVSVNCGIAYDCFGRELILPTRQEVPFPTDLPPNFSGTIVLVIRLAVSHDAPPGAVCWTHTGTPQTGNVALLWMNRDRLPASAGVVVFEATFTKGMLGVFRTTEVRSTARPFAAPVLGTGTTVAGNTPWRKWNVDFVQGENSFRTLGIQTTIDTSGAGFTNSPLYFASLQGPLLDLRTGQLWPAILSHLTDESIEGFTFRVFIFLPHVPGTDVIFIDPLPFARRNLYVAWLGCQQCDPAGCNCGSAA